MDLTSHPFFSQVEPSQFDLIKEAAEHVELNTGDIIFEEGDPSDALFLVLEGSVAFRKQLTDNEFLTVSYSQKGQYFGEIGVLTKEPRALRAEAAIPSKIARIPGDSLVQLLKHMPGPMENLLQSVIRHLHETTRHYIDDRLHQEKMAVVGSMTNTIIHDFKNPFCLISLSAQLLRGKHSDSETVRLCTNIEKQVDRMVGMTTELAEFSRGEQQIQKSKLSLREIMDEFKSLNAPYFDRENVKIEIRLPEARVFGSKAKLFRVFQNLINNSIEALHGSEGFIRITGEKKIDAGVIQIDVRDNAGGIPEEIRDRFFEPFVTFGKSEGTGLGTAIAKSIIEAHGGKIWFDTATGEGTIFHITLPLG